MLYLQLTCYWFIPTILFVMLFMFLDKKIFEWRVLDLKFYINYFKFSTNTYMFTYKDTKFEIAVSYDDDVNDYFATTKVIINGEKAVTIYSLERSFTKARRIDFCTRRHDYEIKKIIEQARKNLKKKYYEEHRNQRDDYSYFHK